MSRTALAQIEIVAAQLLPAGDFELTFLTNAVSTYGIFPTENLIDFTMVETAAGTGADVQLVMTPPNPAATRRFWVVGPIQLPVE